MKSYKREKITAQESRDVVDGSLTDRKKHSGFYDFMPLPYQSLDENGCLIKVNTPWLRLLGYEETAVIGKNSLIICILSTKFFFKTIFRNSSKRGVWLM